MYQGVAGDSKAGRHGSEQSDQPQIQAGTCSKLPESALCACVCLYYLGLDLLKEPDLFPSFDKRRRMQQHFVSIAVSTENVDVDVDASYSHCHLPSANARTAETMSSYRVTTNNSSVQRALDN